MSSKPWCRALGCYEHWTCKTIYGSCSPDTIAEIEDENRIRNERKTKCHTVNVDTERENTILYTKRRIAHRGRWQLFQTIEGNMRNMLMAHGQPWIDSPCIATAIGCRLWCDRSAMNHLLVQPICPTHLASNFSIFHKSVCSVLHIFIDSEREANTRRSRHTLAFGTGCELHLNTSTTPTRFGRNCTRALSPVR